MKQAKIANATKASWQHMQKQQPQKLSARKRSCLFLPLVINIFKCDDAIRVAQYIFLRENLSQPIHFAAVLEHSPQPGLLKVELLFDHTERMRTHVSPEANPPPLHLGPLLNPLVPGICINHSFLTVQEISGWGEGLPIGGGRLQRVDQAALAIHSEMDVHPKVPLVALLGLVHR